MKSILIFSGAAIAEIAGCFAFVTLVDAPFAGRAYAAYGGVYIAASLAKPDYLPRLPRGLID